MRKYRFMFDPTTGHYAGVTRDESYLHATHEPPIFSYGHQTVWDFKSEWRLVPSEVFYSKMAEREQIKIYDHAVIEKIDDVILKLRIINTYTDKLDERVKYISRDIHRNNDRMRTLIADEFSKLRDESIRDSKLIYERINSVARLYTEIITKRLYEEARIIKDDIEASKKEILNHSFIRSLLCAAFTSFSSFSKRVFDSLTSRFKS